jgi:hypothetical protein
MKLTGTQHRWLRWFAEHGGMGYLKASRICCGEDESNRSGTAACAPFLALVAAGAVEGHEGKLRITPFGLRVVDPWAGTTSKPEGGK